MTAAELPNPNFNDASQLIMESKKLKTRASDTFLATATALLRVMGINPRSKRKIKAKAMAGNNNKNNETDAEDFSGKVRDFKRHGLFWVRIEDKEKLRKVNKVWMELCVLGGFGRFLVFSGNK